MRLGDQYPIITLEMIVFYFLIPTQFMPLLSYDRYLRARLNSSQIPTFVPQLMWLGMHEALVLFHALLHSQPSRRDASIGSLTKTTCLKRAANI